ncbi:hypothetical protein GCM10028819_32620 [Spirosoma humi]
MVLGIVVVEANLYLAVAMLSGGVCNGKCVLIDQRIRVTVCGQWFPEDPVNEQITNGGGLGRFMTMAALASQCHRQKK